MVERGERGASGAGAGSNEALVAALRDEIVAAGRVTFARYMARVLYHPDHGYYLGAEARPGRGGDFLTAPELSPLFGRCLARQFRQVWELLDRPTTFTILEYGVCLEPPAPSPVTTTLRMRRRISVTVLRSL